jgi:hypothetical protein
VFVENEKPYDADVPDVQLGDIVRFGEPYRTRVRRTEQLYRFGIVVEILQVTPRGKVRNVSCHVYTADGHLYLGPNAIPQSWISTQRSTSCTSGPRTWATPRWFEAESGEPGTEPTPL